MSIESIIVGFITVGVLAFFVGLCIGISVGKGRCKHKWKSHTKGTVEKGVYDQEQGKEIWLKNVTREVLICETCGKIKTIEY